MSMPTQEKQQEMKAKVEEQMAKVLGEREREAWMQAALLIN